MNASPNNLAPISFDALYEGMVVDYGIYYRDDNAFVLLCKDVVLTASMIKNLRRVSGGANNVYVEAEQHERILRESNYLVDAQHKLESTVGYDKLKSETFKLIDIIAENGTIPEKSVAHMVDVVDEKLASTDPGLLIQCLNGVREIDQYLYTHNMNVGMLNGLMGRWLKLPEVEIKTLIKIGLMHDIGKLMVPAEILNSPRALTAAEFAVVKNHPRYGYDMLKKSGETNALVLRGVLQHHEKMNGKGYPSGLHSDDISYYARITSVCDVYDAMVARRSYKKPHSPFQIFDEFAKGRYSDLDIELVNLFLKNMPLEMVGKRVLMSTGSVAKVAFINPNNFAYPIVSMEDSALPTNESFYCLSMYFDSI